jgi:hypothetical protein
VLDFFRSFSSAISGDFEPGSTTEKWAKTGRTASAAENQLVRPEAIG